MFGSPGNGRRKCQRNAKKLPASAEGGTEARAALEGLYRAYCYPVYAFIRRRSYGRPDAGSQKLPCKVLSQLPLSYPE